MPWTALAPPARWRPPVPAWQRRAQGAGVLLAVALVHAWLIGPVAHTPGRPPQRPAAVQVVALPAPVPPPATAPAPPAPQPPAERPAEPPPPAAEPPRPSDQVDWTAGPTPPEAVAGSVVTPADIAEPAPPPTPRWVADAWADEAGRAASVASGELPALPPPVYRTALPTQGFLLAYRVEQGDAGGHGMLRVDLQEDGRYRAHLQAATEQRQVMDWVSHGRFDAAGVAPERMVERRRGRDVQAVNFQRDHGVISFSGSTRALMLHGGAQDRASLLLQLMAIAQAQPGGLQAGQVLRLQVAGTRGQAEDWRFEVAGEEVVQPAGQPLPALRLVREPSQPYDQRVEVWLARTAGHLPVGLRLTTVPGREPVSLWLEGRLPTPGGTAGP